MKRFRITLLVVCLLLAWLGYKDLSLLLRNDKPQQLNIRELVTQGPGQEWLEVTGGYQDLLQAINMSGTMEIDAFLVPLKRTPESQDIHVWFETRDPQIVELLKTYYFKTDSDQHRQKLVQENKDFIYAQRDVQGMTVDNLVADSNREKLRELLAEMRMNVPDNVIFLSEGKEPTALRGYFYAGIAIIGLLKLIADFLANPRGTSVSTDEQIED